MTARSPIDAAYEAWDAFKPTQHDASGYGAMEAALLAAISAMSPSIVAAVSANVFVRDGQTVINGPGAVADILAAVSPAEQVGIRAADEPKPSVEVERLREALEPFAAIRINGENNSSEIIPNGYYGANPWREDVQRARAALSRKQEPGVPTPGGEG